MTGISTASGILAARNGLWSAIEEATAGEDLDRYYGMPGEVQSAAWVGIGGMSAEFDPRGVSQRRAGDETITFEVSIGKWVPGHRDTVAEDAFAGAFNLLSLIQRHITQDDITLGGAVLWCLPGAVRSDGIDNADGSGFVAEIVADFVCMHRVRAL